jgi:hypothetical protein
MSFDTKASCKFFSFNKQLLTSLFYEWVLAPKARPTTVVASGIGSRHE